MSEITVMILPAFYFSLSMIKGDSKIQRFGSVTFNPAELDSFHTDPP